MQTFAHHHSFRMTISQPAAQQQESSNYSSDDEDVAFAYMNFDGVDFGEGTVKSDDVETDKNDEQHQKLAISATNNATDISYFSNGENECSHETATPSSQLDKMNSQKIFLSTIFINANDQYELDDDDERVFEQEKDVLLPGSQNASDKELHNDTEMNCVRRLFRQLEEGAYADILRSEVAEELFGSNSSCKFLEEFDFSEAPYMIENIKLRALDYCSKKEVNKTPYVKCVELELIGVAALNLFLQLNYTGPSLDRGLKPEEGTEQTHPLHGIHPHSMFENLSVTDDGDLVSASVASPLAPIPENNPPAASDKLSSLYSLKENTTSSAFHNAVLSELATDGEWPFQVCRVPYFLLLARSILSLLAEPTRPFWNWTKENTSRRINSSSAISTISEVCGIFSAAANKLACVSLWNARAIVAHRRLITVRRDDDDGSACQTLWVEAETMFDYCLKLFCEQQNTFTSASRNSHVAGSVMLEWGLANHHFRKAGKGKTFFHKALSLVKLEVEVTGAEGKRTKYQQVCLWSICSVLF